MSDEKDIRFTQKKVDEAWKESVSPDPSLGSGMPKGSQTADRDSKQAAEDFGKNPMGEGSEEGFSDDPQISFGTFISSLGFQGLVHLGEVENPVTRRKEARLEAVMETIDLLLMLKEKTEGNLTPEENGLLSSLIADLQTRYVKRTG